MTIGNLTSIAYVHETRDLDFVKNCKTVPEIDVEQFRVEFTSKDPVELELETDIDSELED